MDSFNDMDMIEVMACETLVPFYDMPVSCGLPTGTGDIPPEMIKVPGNDNNLVDTYAIRVQGDSMIGVGIFDGDILMVQKINHVDSGKVVVVSVDGEWLVKTYYRDDQGNHWLVPANDNYEPILLTEDMELYFGGRILYNMRTPYDDLRDVSRRITRYKQTEMMPEPARIPTQEEIEDALCSIQARIKVARHWLGPCRVLMDCGFLPHARYDIFCDLVKYVLPHHPHLPNEAELRRMAVGCFSKEFAKWTDEKAPVHGKNYLGYYDAGEAMLRKLP